MFFDRGWFLDDVNSLAGVTVSGDHAFGTIISFPADGSVYRWITNKPLGVGDEYQFSTTGLSINNNEMNFDNYRLLTAYPNPFNPITSISFSIPEQSHTTLTVYDVKGNLISTFLSKTMNIGHHQMKWNAENLSSGTYFIQINSGQFSYVKKVVLVK